MTEEGLSVGQLVRSIAGRDAGTYFLVVGVKDSRHVMVADGRLRHISRPKKKNVRHLEVLSARVDEAEARFAASRVVTDRNVAEAIDELLAKLDTPALPAAGARREAEAQPVGGGELPEEDAKVYG
jgi:ribosomal protein L14E/L6E/L27E